MEEFFTILFGSETSQAYMAAQILGLIGFIAMSIVNYYYRTDKTIPWSFKKWVNENWPLVALLVTAMYIGLRWQADIVYGISSHTTSLSFIVDKWFWFIIGGFMFRVILHQAKKFVN